MADNDVFDMYHTCRWCKHFNEYGYCMLDQFNVAGFDASLYKTAEEGHLSEVIEETLNSNKPEKLIRLIDGFLGGIKVSKKNREEVKKLFNEVLPEYFDFELKEKLDENISRLYQERFDNAVFGALVEIKDPESFYCCRWE